MGDYFVFYFFLPQAGRRACLPRPSSILNGFPSVQHYNRADRHMDGEQDKTRWRGRVELFRPRTLPVAHACACPWPPASIYPHHTTPHRLGCCNGTALASTEKNCSLHSCGGSLKQKHSVAHSPTFVFSWPGRRTTRGRLPPRFSPSSLTCAATHTKAHTRTHTHTTAKREKLRTSRVQQKQAKIRSTYSM